MSDMATLDRAVIDRAQAFMPINELYNDLLANALANQMARMDLQAEGVAMRREDLDFETAEEEVETYEKEMIDIPDSAHKLAAQTIVELTSTSSRVSILIATF